MTDSDVTGSAGGSIFKDFRRSFERLQPDIAIDFLLTAAVRMANTIAPFVDDEVGSVTRRIFATGR
jgi:hypothetical protein